MRTRTLKLEEAEALELPGMKVTTEVADQRLKRLTLAWPGGRVQIGCTPYSDTLLLTVDDIEMVSRFSVKGGVLVGDDVSFDVDLQFDTREQAAAACDVFATTTHTLQITEFKAPKGS